jgi:hypothetical protein
MSEFIGVNSEEVASGSDVGEFALNLNNSSIQIIGEDSLSDILLQEELSQFEEADLF